MPNITTASTQLSLTMPASSLAMERVFTPAAQQFLIALHQRFNDRRLALLQQRQERQLAINAGEWPTFLAETEHIREANWQVAPLPPDLLDRRVEITGPVDRKIDRKSVV